MGCWLWVWIVNADRRPLFGFYSHSHCLSQQRSMEPYMALAAVEGSKSFPLPAIATETCTRAGTFCVYGKLLRAEVTTVVLQHTRE